MKKEMKKQKMESNENLTRLIKKIQSEAKNEVRKTHKKTKSKLETFENETAKLIYETKEKEIGKEVSRIEFIKKRTESEYEQQARRILIQSRENLIDEVFEKIERELSNFRSKPEFREYITTKLESAVNSIKNKQMKIIIDEQDMKLIKVIVNDLNRKKGLSLIIETPGIKTLGGFILTDKEERIKIDHTINNLLEARRELIRTKINELLFN
ncbi:MAG: V-type ATP synthase subunit E [Candidatus Heimdallarchaeota archaeon]|nr:V-type ATP synthase subunit E [Candidatus Heimdallarchaeota archaeon]MCK4953871.1 V-type ATP synthase subunit E [Candidatus Heimdallarchaeota archaeon]